MPDQLHAHFGRGIAILGSIVLFIWTAPAAYILSLGVLLQTLTGWSLTVTVLVAAIFNLAYLYRGGFRSVVLTDKIQFALMFLGFLTLVPFCVVKFGGLGWLVTNLPPTHLQPLGGQPLQNILVWYVIASATLVEPAFYQRCYAAKDEATARRGLILSVCCWFLFDLLTTTAGLYARAALPDLAGVGELGAKAAFPALGEVVFPPVLSACFMVTCISTVMGTIDSYSFLAATTFGRDIVGRLVPPSKADPNRWSRDGLVITAVVSVGLALWSRSVVDIWHDVGSIGIPVLLFPMMLTFTTIRVRSWFVVLATALGGGTSLFWVLWEVWKGSYPLGLQPIFPGLGVSAVLLVAGMEARRGSAGVHPER